MAYDMNECRFSGTVSNIKRIQTKTSVAMTVFHLQSWKTKVDCCCFKELAEQAAQLQEGSRAAVTGKIQNNSYQKPDGLWVNTFRLAIESIAPDQDDPEQNTRQEPQRKPRQQSFPDQAPADDRDLSQYDAQEGDYF